MQQKILRHQLEILYYEKHMANPDLTLSYVIISSKKNLVGDPNHSPPRGLVKEGGEGIQNIWNLCWKSLIIGYIWWKGTRFFSIWCHIFHCSNCPFSQDIFITCSMLISLIVLLDFQSTYALQEFVLDGVLSCLLITKYILRIGWQL